MLKVEYRKFWTSQDNVVLTRSSATAEKQRVSCACLPRLANWSCNAQNTAESQRLSINQSINQCVYFRLKTH